MDDRLRQGALVHFRPFIFSDAPSKNKYAIVLENGAPPLDDKVLPLASAATVMHEVGFHVAGLGLVPGNAPHRHIA